MALVNIGSTSSYEDLIGIGAVIGKRALIGISAPGTVVSTHRFSGHS